MKHKQRETPGQPRATNSRCKSLYNSPVLKVLGTVAALTRGGLGTQKDGRNVSKK